MQIQGWTYYNHAAIPTTPPHVTPDASPIVNGEIWKIAGKKPLLARWTSEFDCGYETNWWYLIKDGPFDMDCINAKEKKSIRRAIRACFVKKIDPVEFAEELYDCYVSACLRYDNADNISTKENFIQSCERRQSNVEYWGGFDIETNTLIG